MKSYKFLIIVLSFVSVHSVTHSSIIASTELTREENPDSHVLNEDGAGEDINVLTIAVDYNKSLKKILGFKVKSSSSFDLKLFDENKAYDGHDLINNSDVDTNLRTVSFSQSFNLSKKASKNLIVNFGVEGSLSKGHTVEQEFRFAQEEIIYHVIEDEHSKFSIETDGAYRLTKKQILRYLYRFSQFDHKNPYTFLEEQGSNDRRIQTIGLLYSYKFNKDYSVILQAQQDNITYRDRLALDQVGFFRNEGLVEASKIIDRSIDLTLPLYKKFVALKLSNFQRFDLVDNGDGFNQSSAEISLNKNIGAYSLVTSYSYGESNYKSQLDTEADHNRIDLRQVLKFTVTRDFKLEKESKVNIGLLYHRYDIDSNNEFGEYTHSVLGLNFNKTF